ncbi:MAG: hypothetical protein K6T81_01420 [Alicyclobacillus macrosporangiidus]|uniref:hypothetical protein n=1 Tax=Alicyclobacillus macrosporangiidus TaxID=392015 RepID=UPI0026EE89AD|nr:hypothetical protein [Alicyclobacillus macrosporangiidus]MCL6597381.1 hypothetical protein [Alicyclobacillus macrosporangiidus]
MITSTKKRLSATVYYLLTGLGLSVPALLAGGAVLPDWAAGASTMPLSLADIHLLFLGVMSTIACGVLYQIVPIAFQAPPIGRHVLAWHLPLHVASVIAMVAGFLTADWRVVGWGGLVMFASLAAYLRLVLASYRRARNKTAVHRALVLPLLGLAGVLLVGLWQAWLPARVSDPVVQTHVLFGVLAFWVGLVLVFSYKLFPMFVISHGYQASLARTMVLFYPAAALLLLDAWLPPSGWRAAVRVLAALAIVAAVTSFGRDMRAVWKASKRRRVVPPVYEAAVVNVVLGIGVAWVMAALAAGSIRWLPPGGYLLWFGGLLPLMFAYMQKMVPFLWFEYRFSKRPERKTAPLIDDMVPARPANLAMGLYGAGVLAGLVVLTAGAADPGMVSATGTGTGGFLRLLAWIGAILQAGAAAVLFFSLRHVLTIGGPRPEDDAESGET